MTKVFTVLAVLLQENMHLDDPITMYVPELETQERWKDVTLRMLAGQHGGVYRDSKTSLPSNIKIWVAITDLYLQTQRSILR